MRRKAGRMEYVMNNSFFANSSAVDPDDDECDHDKLCDSDE
jgi:hypothetical protein